MMNGRVLAAVLLLAAFARAEDNGDLEKRLQEVERENRELRERVARLEETSPEEALARKEALARDVESYVDEGLGLNLVIRRGNVRGTFQIFGDTGVSYANPEMPNRGHTFFFDGNIDFFFTARVGDHFRVLTETVFLSVIREDDDASKFDQERLWAAWEFSDVLQVKFGLEHSPISRWNYLYHHGRWLELTVLRPLLARFEADGGILPMHDAGVEFSGAVTAAGGRLSYFVFVSNGRGPMITDVQEFSDHNDSKAVTAGLGFQPAGPHPLFVGVVFRVDEIPTDSTDPARIHSILETIGSVQVDYRGERVQVLFEFAWIHDRDRTSDTSFDHLSGYLQCGYSLTDEWTPYIRVDFREMDQGDPYYAPIDRDLDVWEIVTGVRYDFIDNAAIKFEIGFGGREERDGVGAVGKRGYIRIGLQLAFVF